MKYLSHIGRLIATHLQKPAAGYEPFKLTDPALRAYSKPDDIVLIESHTNISGIIKSPQSTWSHAELCVGQIRR